ncbi:MAG: FtsX-like permease family protein [Bacteroidetes bacterium]|nr:FtsX-like permease family protein [Bacteroidota bacterium]
MFRNYFITAYRTFIRNKTFSFINILSLTLGLVGFMFILLYIYDELSFDKHNDDFNRIFRIGNSVNHQGVGEVSSSVPFPIAPYLEKEYPEMIDEVVRFFNFQIPKFFIQYDSIKAFENRVFFADSNVFEIFKVEFIKGNPDSALANPFTMVITESMAKKYFGRADPIGQSILLDDAIKFRITNVVKDPPLQSHFHWDFLSSMSTVDSIYKRPQKSWIWNPCWTYVKLNPNFTKEELQHALDQIVVDNYSGDEQNYISFFLQNLKYIHLSSDLAYEIEPNSSILNILLLAGIALFILIIACISFMNLATAFSAARAKEIGIKKVLGAKRSQLIFQFLTESIFLCFISLFLSLSIVELVLPLFNEFADKSIELNTHYRFISVFPLFIICILTGFIAGFYPAFFLSKFEPVKVLRIKSGKLSTAKFGRKILVILQFSISAAIIIITLIAMKQVKYVEQKDLGFNHDEILIITSANSFAAYYFDSIKQDLLQTNGIVSVTASDYRLGINHNTHDYSLSEEKDEDWLYYPALMVRNDFIKTYDIELVTGRDYSEDYEYESYNSILINESMVRHQDWTNEEAIGKTFHSKGQNEKVIGVVKDFHVQSLHMPKGPFLLDMIPPSNYQVSWTNYISVRLEDEDIDASIVAIEKIWNKYVPNRPFEYSFLKDDLIAQYESENRFSSIAGILSLLTIFIAALGLFGLTSYLTELRTKEIGIRKVLGASNTNIIFLLAKEFVYLILWSNLLAWPLAFLFLKVWFANFAYQVNIGWEPFAFSAILTFAITALITIYKAIQVSRRNPVVSLRYE